MTGQRTETEMARFFALLDGHDGAYGVAFPDAPGATAMGRTVDEALRNAAAAIADWIDDGEVPEPRSIDELRQDPEVAEQLADGAAFVVVPAIVEDSRPVKANISMEAGLLGLSTSRKFRRFDTFRISGDSRERENIRRVVARQCPGNS